MQQILSLIYSNGDPMPSQAVPSWERVPWIEQKTAADYLEDRPSPRLISSHLPHTVFPESFFASQAKVSGAESQSDWGGGTVDWHPLQKLV